MEGRGPNGRLANGCVPRHDLRVWRRTEPVLDRETFGGIIRKLMSIDTKLDRLLDELLEDDGEAEADA